MILIIKIKYQDIFKELVKKISNQFINIANVKKQGLYKCELYHKDKLIIKGEGISKKKSEQDVSKKALQYFNVIT